jgi:N,N'-diacetyllegionaminate synthase
LDMLFIAEIGLNHNGNWGVAYELIRQASRAGADIAKFQLGWRAGPGEMNEITPAILGQLKRWCDYFGIELMFSVFTPEAYRLLRPLNLARYKIASRTVKDQLELVRTIAAEGKMTIISLGMWEGPELPIEKADHIRYLWCRSRYPCEPPDLIGLPRDFGATSYDGYSDHSIGIEAALLAIARGATIIEKHLTLDKSDMTIRDHALSATPDEFRTMVQSGRDLHRLLRLGV